MCWEEVSPVKHPRCHLPRLTRVIDEEIYTNAKLFVPERWYSKTDLVKEKSAFSPFAMGPYGCIGKPLALMQMRTLIARIIMDYDVKFADGEDGSRLMHDSKDHFTMGLADMELVFAKR
jgi:cytochrome P450